MIDWFFQTLKIPVILRRDFNNPLAGARLLFRLIHL